MEIWKDIKDYEGLYQVSNYGRVRSLNYGRTGRIELLKQNKDKYGYLIVGLYKNGIQKTYKVHRLVAEVFIPNPNNLPQVNHKSEDKQDNRVENIEYCDTKYNINFGTRNERVSEKMTNGKRSKQILQFSKIGEFIREWPSTNEAGRNGFDQGAVAACCRGERKSHKGYLWKYK